MAVYNIYSQILNMHDVLSSIFCMEYPINRSVLVGAAKRNTATRSVCTFEVIHYIFNEFQSSSLYRQVSYLSCLMASVFLSFSSQVSLSSAISFSDAQNIQISQSLPPFQHMISIINMFIDRLALHIHETTKTVKYDR